MNLSEKKNVLLVDDRGVVKGVLDKLAAHKEPGYLHQAVSVFVFNTKWELLLQQRAHGKYHSGGLWANTACTHVYEGEEALAAAERCLADEMGMKDVALSEAFSFTYRAEVGKDLIEHEFGTVFIGFTDNIPVPDESEVKGIKYQAISEVLEDLKCAPYRYAPWFEIIITEHITELNQCMHDLYKCMQKNAK